MVGSDNQNSNKTKGGMMSGFKNKPVGGAASVKLDSPLTAILKCFLALALVFGLAPSVGFNLLQTDTAYAASGDPIVITFDFDGGSAGYTTANATTEDDFDYYLEDPVGVPTKEGYTFEGFEVQAPDSSNYGVLSGNYSITDSNYDDVNFGDVDSNKDLKVTLKALWKASETASSGVCKIADTSYATLAAAIEAAVAGDTISLTANIEDLGRVDISKDVTLDLNGHQLEGYDADSGLFIVVSGSANVTVKDSGSTKGKISNPSSKGIAIAVVSGTITIDGAKIESSWRAMYADTDTADTITINVNSGSLFGSEAAIVAFGNDTTDSVTVNVKGGKLEGAANGYALASNGATGEGGVTFNIAGGSISAGTGIYSPSIGGKVIISGGTITGSTTGVEVGAGELTITGGTITSTASEYSVESNDNGITTVGAAVAIAQHTTKQEIKAAISGGTFSGPVAVSEADPMGNQPTDVSLDISDGSFTATLAGQSAVVSADCSKFITGGTFVPTLTADLVSENSSYDSSTGKVTEDEYYIVKFTNGYGGEEYTDLQQKVKANEDGEFYATEPTTPAAPAGKKFCCWKLGDPSNTYTGALTWDFAQDQIDDSGFEDLLTDGNVLTLWANWVDDDAWNITDFTYSDDNKTVTGLSESGKEKLKKTGNIDLPATGADGVTPIETVGDGANHRTACPFTHSGIQIGKLTVPASVKKIANYAFSSNGWVGEIEFEAGSQLEEIGNYAFMSNRLKSLTLPSSVRKIGNAAFGSTSKSGLTTLVLNDGLESIGSMAFNNTSLTEVDLPSSVTSLAKNAFMNNSAPDKKATLWVTDVKQLSDTSTFFADGTYHQTRYKWNSDCFTYSANGKMVTGLTDAGKEQLQTVTSLTIPSSSPSGVAITAIGEKAFSGTSDAPLNITSVFIPSSITTIGQQAFTYSNLTAVTLPDTVTTLGAAAFNNCQKLESLSIGGGVTVIPQSCFLGTHLKSISIPAQVTKIERFAFADTYAETIEFATNSKLETIEQRAFYNSRAAKLDIPESVKTIGASAFNAGATNGYLKTLTLHEGLTTIEEGAFDGSGLATVDLPTTVTTLSKIAFNGSSEGTVTLYVTDEKQLNDSNAFAALGMDAKGVHHITMLKENNPSYTVKFDANSGSLAQGTAASSTLERGKTITKPADATRDGYTFKGWSSAKDGKTAFDFKTPVIENVTLYAMWEKVADPTPKPDPTPNPDSQTKTIKMYRFYNQWSGEHFFTGSDVEKATLEKQGWTYESIGWYAPEKSNTPVYRMYNSYAEGGDHHYTTSAKERDMLVAAGWTDEGIAWYSDDAKGVAIYCQYNPYEFAHNHNYTSSVKEKDWLVGQGWNDEDIKWYGVKA